MAKQLPADQAAREGELFRLLVENVKDYAIFILDEERRVCSWSHGAEALLGYREDEILGESGDRFFTPEDLATGEPEKEMREALETGRGVDDRWHVRKDGSRFWTSGVMTSLRDQAGRLRGFAKLMRDRTDWWRTHQALRESEARKSAVLSAAIDAIITIDHAGRVVEFNPAAERTFGLDASEAVGREMSELIIPPSMREAHRRGFSRYLATGQGEVLGRRIELTGMRAGGAEFPVELAISRIPMAGPPMFTAHLRDITDRKRAEAAAAERKRLAEFGRDIGLVLTGSATLDEMLSRTAEVTVRYLDAAFARIWTVDESGGVLELRASAGMYTHLDGPHARVPVGQFKIGRIAQERRPHLTNSVIGDPRVPAQDWARREGMVAFAGYPLVVGDRMVGVWALFARHELSEGTLRAMESVADGIAVGVERMRAAEALAKSEAWLSTTLSSIGDAVIATDGSGRVRFMNPIAETLTGWPQPEAEGRPIEEVFRIINEHTRRPAEHPVSRVIREGVTVGLANHTVLIARGGGETPIDDSAAPIKDESGGVSGVVMVFRDVTDERAARRLVLDSEERYRTLVEVSPQAVWAGRPDGFITYFNKWWLDYTGLTMEQSEGAGWAQAVHPDHRERVAAAWLLAAAEGAAYEVEIPFRRASDGTHRWHLARGLPVKDAEGRVVKWTGVAFDIDDRKRAGEERERLLEALEAERRHLQTVIDSSQDCIKELDTEGRLIAISGNGQRMLGIHDACEVLNKPWIDFWKGPDREAAAKAVADAVSGGVGSFEGFCPTASGEPKWWDVMITPINDARGKPERLLSVSRDITDRKRHADERERLLAEAQEANRAKSQFLAVLSHELRTPLNPILLAVTSMLDRPTPPEEFAPTLEMIRHNVGLQARLIDDLLDVMRIVQGKMPLHWGVADCHEVVRHAVQVCQSEVFGKVITLSLDLSADRHHINADSARLQQVFWNLIKNAVKFSPQGGTITIRTRNEVDPEDRGDRLVIEVSDTGIGIEPDVLPNIFDPFQQGETSITRKFGGLGLGLAICRGVVEAHGGLIAADSEGKGRGTTFRIVMKALPSPAAGDNGRRTDPDSARTAPSTPAATLKILVVEDEPATRRLMARLLRGLGHEVTAAGTIAEGTEATAAQAFDLIISDIGLPDGSGLDLMRRAGSLRGKVPAIALTGYGMEEDIVRSREAGFTAHMTKPIDFTKLEAMIRQVTGGRAAPAAAADNPPGAPAGH